MKKANPNVVKFYKEYFKRSKEEKERLNKLKDKLTDEAAIFLEDNHISGDTLVKLDHNIDGDPDLKDACIHLSDLLADFIFKKKAV